MATIYIDNIPYEVNPEENLLHECLSLGFNLPYFCWHPAMGSVGACRQCAVKQFKDEKDTQGKIIMACMTPASDGTRISIDDPEAKAFRASVIEWLMLNHPQDCPVCDEGGECHLQDMTVMTGHDYRRTRFRKRTYRNQYLGPFINHEMNRCIQCYRCVRYYRDYAGGRDFNVFSIHDSVYFGRSEPGTLENEFSGNLVEVCPTGVFTDKTLARHYTRKWDMTDAPSICVHCGLGCNISPRARYGTLRRIVNRYNFEINKSFICDRGRFGYEFVNSSKRIRIGRVKSQTDAKSLVEQISALIQASGRILGIGSPRASLESNFALRSLVGPDNFFNGMAARESNLISAALEILRRGPARIASIHDVEQSDAVFVLGEDLPNTAPRLALALLQSIRQKPMERADALKIPRWHDYAVRTAVQGMKGPLIVATPYRTNMDANAAEVYHATPDDVARFGYAVANAISSDAPPVPELSDEVLAQAKRAAQLLMNAVRPTIITGTGNGTLAVLEAASNIAAARYKVCGNESGICITLPECNSLGSSMLAKASLEDAFHETREEDRTIIVMENDLYRRTSSKEVDEFFGGARIIAMDSIENATTAKAEVLLPSATFAESEGTYINNEGRAQRFYKVLPQDSHVRESWRWLKDIMVALGRMDTGEWPNLDAVIGDIQKQFPELQPISQAAPPASFRIAGQKIPRQSHRYSGRTAMSANVSVHEPAPPPDPDSPFSFSMEGYQGRPPAGLASLFWAPGWNSCQAVNRYQKEIGGPLLGGPAGIRIISPEAGEVGYFRSIPGAFERRPNQILVLKAYRIFGSEELSVLSPAIAERAAPPSLAISASDAATLGISDGQVVRISISEFSGIIAAHIDTSLPAGVAALPTGMPELTGIDLPAWGSLEPSRL